MKKIHLFPFLFILFLSCQKEENLISPEVDERLTFFFESFKKEGSSRGQYINMEDIIGQIIDIETDGVLGRCNQLTSGKKHILIDKLF